MIATGAYLRSLRDKQGLTQEAVASDMGISSRTLSRWENGETEPPATALAALVRLLNGSVADALALLLDTSATVEDGERKTQEHQITEAAHHMTDDELQEAIAILEALRTDQRALGRWFGFGESLRTAVEKQKRG